MTGRTLDENLSGPGAEFEAIAERGEDAALRVSEAFQDAGSAISDALGSAARVGELEFSRMAESILQDLARIALESLVVQPIQALGDSVGQSLALSFADVIGQRQSGGPVLSGAPYLVGEQGPEVFVPQSTGAIATLTPTQVINVTIQTNGDPVRDVQRSGRQISAAVARAAAAGGRLL